MPTVRRLHIHLDFYKKRWGTAARLRRTRALHVATFLGTACLQFRPCRGALSQRHRWIAALDRAYRPFSSHERHVDGRECYRSAPAPPLTELEKIMIPLIGGLAAGAIGEATGSAVQQSVSGAATGAAAAGGIASGLLGNAVSALTFGIL